MPRTCADALRAPALAMAVLAAAVLCPAPARASTSAEASSAYSAEDAAMLPDARLSGGAALPRGALARPFGAVVNGQPAPDPCLVATFGNLVLVRQSDLAALGIRLPGKAAAKGGNTVLAGEPFVGVAEVPGLAARIDESSATLYLDADPAAFPSVRIGRTVQRLPPPDAVPAAFIDYDASVYDWNGDLSAAALVDAGVSGRWGVFDNTFTIESGGKGVTRLSTTFQRDFVQQGLRLTVGDGVTRGAAWSEPVRFAGLRIGTDFSLDPSDITFPLPSLSGSAALPSTIDLVSAGLRQSYATGPGRFAVDFMPRFTGAGQVTMTVRDTAGNERQVVRQFYSSPNLLRPGLDAWSVEVGALRQDYGLRSFAYGAPFAGATWRRGIASAVTLEGRIEASSHGAAQGMAANFTLGAIGEVGLAGAISEGPRGTGTLYKSSFQRRTPKYAIAASYEHADAAFRQVGDDRPAQGARSDLALAGSMELGRAGNVSLGYLSSRRGDQRTTIGSLAWSASLRTAFLSFGAQRAISASTGNTTLFANLTIPLGRRADASVIADRNRAAVSYNQAAPSQGGVGYRLLAGHELDRPDHGSGAGGEWLEAGATLQGNAGTLDLQAVRRAGQNGARLTARGGVVAAGGRVALTPHLDAGLALVDLLADTAVTVMVENRPTPQRIGNGRRAIVTGLQPYGANRIAIDPAELPISDALPAYEMVVAPGWRQVARVHFSGTARARPLRLRLHDERGAALPAGLVVVLEDGSETVTGIEGEVFLPDAAGSGSITVNTEPPCTARLPAASAQADLAQAIDLACLPPTPKD